MSTSREELDALNEWIREPDYAESFTLEDMTDWLNRRPIAVVARLAATPKAGVDREVIARTLEGIILRRMHEKRIEGYTLEMSRELADALPSVLGGVDQPRIATKPSPSRAEDSATETGCLRSVGWLTDPNDSDAPKFFGAVVEYKNGCFPKLPMTAVWDGTPVRITALPQTDTPPPDNAGLVSGGGK